MFNEEDLTPCHIQPFVDSIVGMSTTCGYLCENSVMIAIFTRRERNTMNIILSYSFGAYYVSRNLDVLNLSKHAQERMRGVRYHQYHVNVCTDPEKEFQ